MDSMTAIFLGIIQGLTEFLPVSSSGHLVIFQHLFGLTEPELFFDVSVHVGTLLAVVIFYRRMIGDMARAAVNIVRAPDREAPDLEDARSRRLILMVVIGSIPTAVMGLVFKSYTDQLFASMKLVGVDLLITGLLLFLTGFTGKADNSNGTPSGRLDLTVVDALVIGVVQGLAILPGISRSGITISTGLFLGLSRPTAAAFSFILSIPAITGAALLVLKDALEGAPFEPLACLVGTAASFLVGYASLKFLIFIVNKGRLNYFAPYCWLAGVLALMY